MSSAHIEPGITLRLFGDGVLHLVVDEGVVLDLAAVRLARPQIADIVGGPYVSVGDLRGVPYIEREARAELALDDDGRVLATAVVTGRDGAIPLLVRLWMEGHHIERQVATFEDSPEALAWAHDAAAALRAEGRFS